MFWLTVSSKGSSWLLFGDFLGLGSCLFITGSNFIKMSFTPSSKFGCFPGTELMLFDEISLISGFLDGAAGAAAVVDFL